MSYTIAICGKGGTGKTTLAALVIRWLMNRHKGASILAVDADPNANLDEALGVKSEKSIVAIADDIAKNPSQIPQGMTRDRYLEYQIQDALSEADGFDLLVMGRPEGAGCYCFVNNLLRTLIERLTKSYAYIVIDNEAGMEHLSRRTTRKIDLLFIVSDYTVVGLRSAKRILDLARELEISVKDTKLIVNRAQGETNKLKEEIGRTGISLTGVIPEDEEISELALAGGNVRKLDETSKAQEAVNKICEGLFRR
ncbi:MAG: AAA family ATPase [Candidatus Omnitrophota bacterium]|nr:MAG: AAA family ATPase [Candidatus Omnitrophota bacterium]